MSRHARTKTSAAQGHARGTRSATGHAFTLADEREEHATAVERLLDVAYGPSRHRKTSQRLRKGRPPERGLSLVAFAGGQLVGTIRFWTVSAGGRRALLLGPLAVDPAHWSQGIGGALVEEALKRAAEAGEDAVLLVGDAPYYGRFGFTKELTRELWLPGPVERDRFLALELKPGALQGARGAVRPLTS
ncbi:MAG: N-acetyltransferase [Alphaproteobacteria bacterium]